MDKIDKIFYVPVIVMAIIGLLSIVFPEACANCACVEQQPDCGYEQHVNPITGELEQIYVCS